MSRHPNPPAEVAAAFQAFPAQARKALLDIRSLLFDVANATPDAGRVQETLKWGEPAYLADGGSTVRLGWKAKRPDRVAIYFICQTPLVDAFRSQFGEALEYEGDRAILIDPTAPPPTGPIASCLRTALTYKRRKK